MYKQCTPFTELFLGKLLFFYRNVLCMLARIDFLLLFVDELISDFQISFLISDIVNVHR